MSAESLSAPDHFRQSYIDLTNRIEEEDFIAAALSATEDSLFATPIKPFTHAILNPPYKKIFGDTDTRAMLYSASLDFSIGQRRLRPIQTNENSL